MEMYYNTTIPNNKLNIDDYVITPSTLKELCHRNDTIEECIIDLNDISKIQCDNTIIK